MPSPHKSIYENNLGDESMSSYTRIPNLIKRDKLKDYELPETTQDLTSLKLNENASLCWLLNPPSEAVDPFPAVQIERSASLNTAKAAYATVFTATKKTLVHVVSVEHLDPNAAGVASLWLKRSGSRYCIGDTDLHATGYPTDDINAVVLKQPIVLDVGDILEILPSVAAFSSTYVNVFYSEVA